MLATMSQRFRVASRVGAAGRGVAAALAAVALASCTTLLEPAVRSAAAAQTPRAAATVPAAMSAPPASPAPSASGPVATAPGGAVPTPRPPGTPSAAAPVSPLRPFAEVIRDARRTEGVLAFWQKDDRVWIELRPQDFDQPFMLASKLKSGIGERGFAGGSAQDTGVVEFRRVYNQVQLVWRNIGYTAAAGSPEALAVKAAFSPSLLASASVLSQPDPERKAVLVEANALFMGDLLGLGVELQRAYRQGYSFDGRNSAIVAARATPDVFVLEVLSHFATASIAAPQFGAPSGFPQPTTPRVLPDARSLFLTVHHSLARLPAEPMPSRRADPRIGYFESSRVDFSNDTQRRSRERFVNRWRLEKKDPAAELSEPVKPIVFWIDRTVPLKYRATVRAGVLEWNKAFEKIGFKDAIHVEQQADDASFDTLDLDRASIRWMTNASPVFSATGPSTVDPRSGEIIGASIAIESLPLQDLRYYRSQILASNALESGNPFGNAELTAEQRAMLMTGQVCTFAEGEAQQMSYASAVLEARGEMAPGSPEAEAFVQAYVKETTMHEVGHTLGLRHNFRASRAYTLKQLADPEFTREHGITGSVMEYSGINLNGPNEPRERYGTPFNVTLGPYDFWAIEYGYRPVPPGSSAADENAMLARIAGRSAEPLLAYGSDEDAFLGIDPETLQFDLGDDPVAFAKKRIAIAEDLLRRQETRQLRGDDDYSVLKRSVSAAIGDAANAAGVLARQIGGVRTVRDAPATGRDPLAPVPVAEQREALAVITDRLLSADGFRVSPALQRKLGTDFSERWEALTGGQGSAQTDYSPSQQLLGLQRALLSVMMSDTLATRLLESSEKAPAGPGRALRMPELYERLTGAVWSELAGRGDIPRQRREVQRDHVNRIAAIVLRPGGASRADTRSVMRVQARSLLERLRAAKSRPGLSVEARAHVADSADTLEQALSARLQRAGA